jgi:hypothetical protein
LLKTRRQPWAEESPAPTEEYLVSSSCIPIHERQLSH